MMRTFIDFTARLFSTVCEADWESGAIESPIYITHADTCVQDDMCTWDALAKVRFTINMADGADR